MQQTESSITVSIWVECFVFLKIFKNNYFIRSFLINEIKIKWQSIPFD